MNIADRFNQFAEHFKIDYNLKQSKELPSFKLLVKEIPEILRNFEPIKSLELKVKGSTGMTNHTPYPWLGIFDKRVSTGATNGFYIVFLFSDNMEKLFLTLNQGSTSQTNIAVANYTQHVYKCIDNIEGFKKGALPQGSLVVNKPYTTLNHGGLYEKTNLFYREYAIGNLNDSEIENDLNKLIYSYEKCVAEYPLKSKEESIMPLGGLLSLSKPFLLLAGISGTGKTRFVKEQADAIANEKKYGLDKKEKENYCLVPVRPDWHEPSDLLGYISRIGVLRYVATPFLKFMVKAWLNAFERIEDDKIVLKDNNNIAPFWLCLDEMNLAPVEQYFADYLSVLETREWKDEEYKCEPLLHSHVFSQLGYSKDSPDAKETDELKQFRNELRVEDESLWNYFKQHGIPLPPNLIVAGTVNMDETTHGFSRKVIDRALTIDFGEFYPNDYNEFFEPQTTPKTLGFPSLARVKYEEDLEHVDADTDGKKSIEFLKNINNILKATPFELAYRALNELLLSVVCFAPKDQAELCAVWDDFLMQKVLPRIEGDTSKLRSNDNKNLDENFIKIYGKGTVLHELFRLLSEEGMLKDIWGKEVRPDLLRDKSDGSIIKVQCRSKKKLEWMMTRLKANHFTDFWV